jgi:hypothetical protein
MLKLAPEDQLVAPALAPHAAIVITAENLSDNTTFKWTHADFGVPTAIEYALHVQIGTGEPALVASVYGDSLDVRLSNLNTVLLQAGATAGVASAVTFTLKASVSETYATVTSTPLTINVSAFAALPTALHLIGNVLGNNKEWNNANYEYVMFRDNNLAVNVYTTKFRAGGFKFISNDDLGTWNNLYGQTGSGILGNQTGGDITDITAEGYYTVTADIGQLTYSITPYDASGKTVYTNISLIGEFNGWGGDLDLTQTDYDPHVWIVDDAVIPAGELKFRANHDWATSWGGDENFPYGNGVGGNIIVPEAGTYFVKFNDLTGHYVFYKK